MPADVRLRQVVLVARQGRQVADELQHGLAWGEPFVDPGIRSFGLTNAVFAVGDTFVEVVTPVEAGTTAGRYLDRRGGDSGYMAIFQVTDLVAARHRVAGLGVRVVWAADHDDIAGTHLHPRDVPGAIVSLDWADPVESWRWAGPSWTGRAPAHAGEGITGMTVQVADPAAAAARWAAVLGLEADDAARVVLEAADQVLVFVPFPPDGSEGITGVTVAGLPVPETTIGGVTFTRGGEP